MTEAIRRWCPDCDDFTPSKICADGEEVCARCHTCPPEPEDVLPELEDSGDGDA